MMILFFVIFFALWVATHVYLARRFAEPLRPERKRWAWAAVGAHFVISLTGMVLRQFPSFEPVYSVVKWVYYVGMGTFFLVFSMVVVTDLGRWIFRGLEYLQRRRREAGELEEVDRERREFFVHSMNIGILAAASGGTVLGYHEARRLPDVVEVTVPLEDLPAGLEGLRIAQLSDVHVGPTVRKRTVARLVEEVNRLDVDLVVITGDLIEGHISHIWDDVSPILELKSRYGTYYCTGNHEYYWDGPGWCEALSEHGVKVLNNDHALIEHQGATLLVAGCTDITAHRFVADHRSDPKGTLEKAPAHDVSVLLAHQPGSIHDAAEAGYDLQLSGHTHGGQFLPGSLVIDLFHPYSVGLHREEKTWIYVSRGTGYWGPPMRLKAPSEITVVELVAGGEERAEVVRRPLEG